MGKTEITRVYQGTKLLYLVTSVHDNYALEIYDTLLVNNT